MGLQSEVPTPRSNSPSQPTHSENELSRHEVGVQVLDMFTDIICDPASNETIIKFTKTVASKVSLYQT